MVDSSTLRSWAAGRPSDAVPEGEDAESGEGEGGGVSAECSAWAGESEEDLADLLPWLAANEPEIEAAIRDLARAVSLEDEELETAAHQALMDAGQDLVPEYPEFTPEQRTDFAIQLPAAFVAADLPEEDTPEFDAALAQTLWMVRSVVEEPEEGDDEDADEVDEELEEDA